LEVDLRVAAKHRHHRHRSAKPPSSCRQLGVVGGVIVFGRRAVKEGDTGDAPLRPATAPTTG
jgi:hypothetical protein